MRGLRDQAIDKMSELLDMMSAERMLEFIISNHLSGAEALSVMQSVEEEFFPEEDDEEEVDGSDWRDSEDFFDENN